MNLLASILNAASIAGGILNINFNPAGFVDMLSYMGKGMLVIFVLIGVIILVTMAINKVFSGKQK